MKVPEITAVTESIRQFLIKTKFIRSIKELDELKTKAINCSFRYNYLHHPNRHYDPVADSYKIEHNILVDEFNSKKYWWMSSLEKI